MDSLFYVGQKVVAIRTHIYQKFIKGEEFIVLDIKQGCCTSLIKINNDYTIAGQLCSTCKRDINNSTGDYYNQESFAPIEYLSNMSYEDAINLVSETITI